MQVRFLTYIESIVISVGGAESRPDEGEMVGQMVGKRLVSRSEKTVTLTGIPIEANARFLL